MRMKPHAELIFIWKVSHLDSFWNRGTRELGNGYWKFHSRQDLRGKSERFLIKKQTRAFVKTTDQTGDR